MESLSADHSARVAELTRRVAAKLSLDQVAPPPDVIELCADFDAAAEFAGCEGRSIAEAIRAFLRDGWGQKRAALAGLVGVADHRGIAVRPLPVMPKAAARLIKTSDEHTSAVELERIAASDPVLAGKIVGAANSARFGSRSEIVRLREAVLRVGIPEARRILLAACFAGFFASKPLQELWTHSVSVAEAACELACYAGIDPELAYIAGLLHDIGRLGFIRSGAPLRIAETEWLAAGFPLVYAESLAYGRDHASAGAEMLSQWDLPAAIVEAVAGHHQPERSDSRLNAALFLAEEMSARAAPEDLWPDMRRIVACERAGIAIEQLDAIQSKFQERVCA